MSKQVTLSKVYGVPVEKVAMAPEGGSVVMRGFFTSDAVDMTGDTITRSATKKAIGTYRRWANLRLMHQPMPVGKVLRIGEEDGLAWNELELEVIDPQAIFMVERGLVTALSVGILVNMDAVEINKDTGGFIINDYLMAEISLVDHPANYDAALSYGKGSSIELDPVIRARLAHEGKIALKSIFAITEEKTMPDTEITPLEEATPAQAELPIEKDLPVEEPVAEDVPDTVVAEADSQASEALVHIDTSAFEKAIEARMVEFIKEISDKIEKAIAPPAVEEAPSAVEEAPSADEAELRLKNIEDRLTAALAENEKLVAQNDELTKRLQEPAERTNEITSVDLPSESAETEEAGPLKKALNAYFNSGQPNVIIQARK